MLDSDRELCDDCLLDHRREQVVGFAAAAREAVARLKDEGKDPSHSPDVRAKLGRVNARRVAEATAWNSKHPESPDPEVFRVPVRPFSPVRC